MKILLVSDDPRRHHIARALTAIGHEVEAVSMRNLAIAKIVHERYDLVITDLELPVRPGSDASDEKAGLAVARAAIEARPSPETVVVMSSPSEEVVSETVALGRTLAISKPENLVQELLQRKILLKVE